MGCLWAVRGLHRSEVERVRHLPQRGQLPLDGISEAAIAATVERSGLAAQGSFDPGGGTQRGLGRRRIQESADTCFGEVVEILDADHP